MFVVGGSVAVSIISRRDESVGHSGMCPSRGVGTEVASRRRMVFMLSS